LKQHRKAFVAVVCRQLDAQPANAPPFAERPLPRAGAVARARQENVAADVSRRILSARKLVPTDVGGYPIQSPGQSPQSNLIFGATMAV